VSPTTRKSNSDEAESVQRTTVIVFALQA